MEQSAVTATAADDSTPDEIEVAEILINLHQLIYESESRPRLSVWGFKKKRSVPIPKEKNPTPSPSPPQQSLLPLPPPPPQPKNTDVASPATPLSFSPSESEEKRKPRKRKFSLKRTREEQIKTINELTQRRELLLKEIDNVKSYYDKLKDYNSALKDRKQQLINIGAPRKEELQAAAHFGFSNQVPLLFHQQGMIMNQTANMAPSGAVIQYGQASCSVLEGEKDKVGPREIPDLNVSLEEEPTGLECSEPFDYKVRSSEARRRRMEIWSNKKRRSNGL